MSYCCPGAMGNIVKANFLYRPTDGELGTVIPCRVLEELLSDITIKGPLEMGLVL